MGKQITIARLFPLDDLEAAQPFEVDLEQLDRLVSAEETREGSGQLGGGRHVDESILGVDLRLR